MFKYILFILSISLCTSLIWADDGFGDIFGEVPIEAGASKFTFNVSGEIGMSMDFYMDDVWDSETKATPYADIALEAGNETIEAKAAFSFSTDNLEAQLKVDDLIDELYVKAFFSFGYLEGGYIKTEWGKGDGDHVIDPLNPLDQSKGVYLDLNDMKSSEILSRLSIYLGGQGLLEFVYKPFFTPMEFSTEGRWSVFDMSSLPGAADIVEPETNKLKYSQAAARATVSLGAFDLGMMYYYGFMTEPGYKFTSTWVGPGPADYTTTTDIVYTGAHLFGIEAAWALGPLTMRTELGYWLTEDLDGDLPEFYNNRFVYLAGLDLTIPGTNLFLSAQIKGAYVFHYDGLVPTDVDVMAAYNNTAFANTVLATAELPFFKEKMKLRVTGLLQIESVGYMIVPSFFWNIKDDLELSVYAKIFGGNNTGNNPYYSWDNNDSISMSMKYMF